MSSFAAANLILSEHRELVTTHMEPQSILLQLNSKWVCYLTQWDGNSPADPQRGYVSVRAVSHRAPVLYFQHPEDHGWSFAVLERGAVASSCSIDYEFRMDLPYLLWERTHPGAGYFEFWESGEQETFEKRAEEAYAYKLQQRFAGIDFSKFSLFGVDGNGIERLRRALTPEQFETNPFSQVQVFTEVLDCAIDFLSWAKVRDRGDARILACK